MTSKIKDPVNEKLNLAFGNEEQNISAEPQKEQGSIKEDDEQEEKSNGVQLSEEPLERANQLSELLARDHDNAPTANQLMQWKQLHKGIFLLPMGDDTYIYRYLKRIEWNKIQTDEKFQKMTKDEVEEYIFDKCVLWPSIGVLEKPSLPSGLIPTINEQIRINSLFLNSDLLAQMTIKL